MLWRTCLTELVFWNRGGWYWVQNLNPLKTAANYLVIYRSSLTRRSMVLKTVAYNDISNDGWKWNIHCKIDIFGSTGSRWENIVICIRLGLLFLEWLLNIEMTFNFLRNCRWLSLFHFLALSSSYRLKYWTPNNSDIISDKFIGQKIPILKNL